jgi:precorrin-3B synthase
MNAPQRRGWCPGLSAPMATGDGLLARLTPSGATISLDAFAGLCAAAHAHGNGAIEITSRGSIQVRGLSAVSAPAFAAAVAALGIAASDGIPVLVDPLSGLDPVETFEASALAADLRAALAASSFASRLAAKVSVIVDGGGVLHLDNVAGDVRLRAVGNPNDACFHVALGGDAATAIALGAVAPARAVECVIRLLEVLTAESPQARMRDGIRDEGLSIFKLAVAGLVADAPASPARPAAQPIGQHPLRANQFAIGVGLPFGHSDSETLQRLLGAADRAGATGLRTAPGRALLLLGLAPDAAHRFIADAAMLGFIVEPSDPRRRVIACAGAPICASGEIPARAMAPAVARGLSDLTDAADIVHVSGCAKGCAYPGVARIAIVGRDGACEVYLDGAPACTVPVANLPERIADVVTMRAEAVHG